MGGYDGSRIASVRSCAAKWIPPINASCMILVLQFIVNVKQLALVVVQCCKQCIQSIGNFSDRRNFIRIGFHGMFG